MGIKRDIAIKMMNVRGAVNEPSFSEVQEGYVALLNDAEGAHLAVVCEENSEVHKAWKGAEFEAIEGFTGIRLGVFPLNSNNAAYLRRLVRWTAPSSCGTKGISMGFSDWLGVRTGQLPMLFANKHIKPVLADISPSTCDILGMTFLDAVDVATWSVFGAAYKDGYAANASAIEKEEDIYKVLLYGYSGIGIDCADKIDKEIEKLSAAEVEERFNQLDSDFREAIDQSYLAAPLEVGKLKVKFEKNDIHRTVLEFGKVVMFAQNIYKTFIEGAPWDLDFEIDFSGGDRVLSVQEHYFIANELKRAAVKFDSLCVDTPTIKQELKENLEYHAAIAKAFDYRLSLANTTMGYDNLGVVAKALDKRVNFKMNNILWLSALQTVMDTDRILMHKIATKSGLELPHSSDKLVPWEQTGVSYAFSADKVLSGEESLSAEIKAAVEKELGLYKAHMTKQIKAYLETL